jgi:hypothetical protein
VKRTREDVRLPVASRACETAPTARASLGGFDEPDVPRSPTVTRRVTTEGIRSAARAIDTDEYYSLLETEFGIAFSETAGPL